MLRCAARRRDPAPALYRRERPPARRSAGVMRFWRPGVPGDPTADTDTVPAEFDDVSASAEPAAQGRWLGRLREGLSRSSARLNEGINTIFLRRRLDAAALNELEELLIASDMGLGVAGEVVEALRRNRFNQEVAPEEVRAALAEEVIRLVEPVMKPLRLDPAKRPFV